MNSYTGNNKPYVYVCYSEKDGQVNNLLNALDEDKIALCINEKEKYISAAYGVLIFLSNNLLNEEKLNKTIETAINNNINILSVQLEEIELNDTLKMQLNSQQALLYDKDRTEADLLKEIKQSVIFNDMKITDKQKANQKKRVLYMASGIIAAVVLLFVFVVMPLLKTEPQDEYDPLEQFGLAGLSEEDLAKITSLHVVGDVIIDNPSDIISVRIDYLEGDDNFSYTVVREISPGENYEEVGTASRGTISDISVLRSLPNLKSLTLASQAIEDISVLSELPNLSVINLSDNPITSLDALKDCEKLSKVYLRYLSVSDLSPLFVSGKLKELDVLACRNISDISGIENTNITFLQIEDTSIRHIEHLPTIYSFGLDDVTLLLEPLDDYSFLADNTRYSTISLHNAAPSSFIPYLEKARIRELELTDCGIERINQLSGLSLNGKLKVFDERFTSLEGIDQVFPYLNTLDIFGAGNLSDLSPVLQSNIGTLIISDEQRDYITQDILDKGIEVLVFIESDNGYEPFYIE